MTRRDLTQKVLIGATTIIILPSAICSCSKNEDPGPGGGGNTPRTITIDLTNPTYTALSAPGGQVIIQSVAVANVGNDNFVALSSVCTHQGGTVVYSLASNKFICQLHFSEFSTTGSVLLGPATTGLKSYAVTKSGDILTINL
jgi:cytochrome b6-f complex iron-sulfur subunit